MRTNDIVTTNIKYNTDIKVTMVTLCKLKYVTMYVALYKLVATTIVITNYQYSPLYSLSNKYKYFTVL